MFGFLLRRVALIVPTFLGVTLLAFALIHLIPGDPVENLSGERGMLQARPGAFARLGQGGADRGGFLHSSRYDFNDSVIPLGAGFLAALAERAMPIAR